MKKKKICFLIESFVVGGAEKVLIDIVNNLDSTKFDITVISAFKYSVFKGYTHVFDSPFNDNVHYKYLINNHFMIGYLLFNFLLQRIPSFLYRLFIGDNYDIAVAFYEGMPTYWLGKARLKRGYKMAWLHTTVEVSQKGKSLEEIAKTKSIYQAYHQIISVSEAVSKGFNHLFSLPSIVLYNPVDVKTVCQKANFISARSINSVPTIVSVGRVIPSKGYDRVIQIAEQLRQRGHSFIWNIVGGGALQDLQDEIKNHNLQTYIKLLGHQSNPYSFIRQADLFVSTSRVEGFGLVLVEALALGTPIISSNFETAYEILGNSQYGLICTTNQEFVTQIDKFLSNPKCMENYVLIGIQRADFFSLERRIKDIEEHL